MEIVLSPGRFGDEPPGVPFQKEEIREWSHVDRLTGMLERARVETGRWQSSNQEAAKSYGKVIDSRERNSADGSIVQRARRQVEIFQSQGRGRSVQVVRASQWSSSRVTDSASTGSSILPVLDQKKTNEGEEKKETDEKLSKQARGIVETKNDRRSRQEAISDRLSALLGTFPYPVTSSTVPLRRIDSRYSSRAPIIFASPKRSNSNEDLASFAREGVPIDRQDRLEEFVSEGDSSMLKYDSTSLGNPAESVERNGDRKCINRSGNVEESVCKPAKSAIQLLPSSKSNRTVVNLMGDDRDLRDIEILDDKRPNLNWIFQTSSKNSQRDFRNEDSAGVPIASQKLPKRVGFSKTEIHFVADSGKVNIVETDEKPPPTNKFRRRKRLASTNKIAPSSHEVNDGDSVSYEQRFPYENTKINDEVLDLSSSTLLPDRDIELSEENSKNEHHRGHTTTVKLGSEMTRDQDIGLPLTVEKTGFSAPTEPSDICRPKMHTNTTLARSRENEGQFCKGEGELREASKQGIVLRLGNRIYDRLEAYTTEIQPEDSSVPQIPTRHEYAIARTDIHQNSALKSARLVMNLTRVPKSSSRVIVEPAIAKRLYEIDRGKEFDVDGKTFEGKTKVSKRSTRNEENNFVEDRDVDHPGIVDKIEETENIIETLTIGKETLEMAGPSESEKKGQVQVQGQGQGQGQCQGQGQASTKSKKKDDSSTEDYDVVCTDAENNQVVLKVVTTHEPTIVRVEDSNDHFSKRLKKPAIKTLASSKIQEIPMRKKCQKEPTYANIFTGSNKNVPIYENYRATRKFEKTEKDNETTKKEAKSCPEKSYRSSESKIQISQSSDSSTSNSANLDKTRISADEKTTAVKRASSIVKKVSQNSSGTSRTGKITRSEIETKRPVKSDVSSNERDSKLSAGIRDEKLESKSREISSSRLRNNNEIPRKKPMEVVYQTAVYNMKNEKLSKPHKKGNKESSKGPRYINELICGAKTKSKSKTADSKSKTSSTVPHSAQKKGASQTIRHWK